MEWNKEKLKQIRDLVLFIALVVLCVMHSSKVWQAVLLGLEILNPFLIGGMLAFILNIPMRLIEEKLLKNWKGKSADRGKRPVSMLLSIVLVVVLLALLFVTIVPQLAQTVNDLGKKIPEFLQQCMQLLAKLEKEYPELQKYLSGLNQQEFSPDGLFQQAMAFLKDGGSVILSTTIGVASGIIGSVVQAIISFIFALYTLASKEKLAGQCKRLLHAFAPAAVEERVLHVSSLLYRNFTHFFTGQCVEAVILGTIFVVVMSIVRMPYAVMIGVLIAFTALIPIVGAFIGCIVGAFLILVDTPSMALWFVVMFLVIQQIEGNLIYPKVVGESVGLPAIWVLVAVSVGGSLFGVAGMIVFIPLVSTGYTLLGEAVSKRNQKKDVVQSKVSPPPGEQETKDEENEAQE